MPLSDQQIAEIRYTTVARKIEAEQQLELIVLAGMDLWLHRIACMIVGQPGPALTADGEPAEPWVNRLDEATAAANEWLLFLDVGLLPQVGGLFGEAFNEARRGDEFNPYQWQQAYMQQVRDRLVIWPEGAFEELRPALMEDLSDAAGIAEVTAKIGDTLGISAQSREHRAAIGEIDRALKAADLSPVERSALVGRRAREWAAHDASLDDWEWMARRIARTEVQGAMEGGSMSAAKAWTAATGEQQWKQWLATEDSRTRTAHVLADGQIVKLEEKFTVGDGHLDHPGEAGGPAHLVIHCRCTSLILDADSLQAELQGPRGSIGEVKPRGSRLGPDDPEVVAQKIQEKEQAERERKRIAREAQREKKPATLWPPIPHVITPTYSPGAVTVFHTPAGTPEPLPSLDRMPGHVLYGWNDRSKAHDIGATEGHRWDSTKPSKTTFPETWSDQKIADTIRAAVETPTSYRPAAPGVRRRFTRIEVDGVVVEAMWEVVDGVPQKLTGYPVRGPGVRQTGKDGASGPVARPNQNDKKFKEV